MKTKLLLFIFLFLTVTMAQRVLTLEEALDIAFDQSFSFKSAKHNLEISQKNFEAQKLGLLTSVNMDFTIPSYNRSLRSQFNSVTGKDEYFKTESTSMNGSINISQPIIYTNTTISVNGFLSYRNQKFGPSETKDFYSDFRIRLDQPIFEFNQKAATYRRTEINEQQSSRQFTQAEFDLIYNVNRSFYSLYELEKRMEITAEKVKQNEVQYTTAKNKYKAGLNPENEMLQQEVALANSKNDLLDAERNFMQAKNNFKFLIGVPLEEEIKIKTNIQFEKIVVDLEEATRLALEKRSDLLNEKDNIELNEMAIDEVSAQKRIKFRFNASYGINKVDEKFGDLLMDVDDSRRVDFTMSVPLLDWGKNSRQVEAAEVNLKLSNDRILNKKIQIKKEIIEAVNKIKSVEARIGVLKRSVELAEKSYNITMARFRTGKITSFELTNSQLELTNTKLTNLSALIEYKLAIADLERKTLTKFNK